MLTALTRATVFTGAEIIAGKAVLIENDRIGLLVDIDEIPEGAKIIDCDNNYIAPGLI